MVAGRYDRPFLSFRMRIIVITEAIMLPGEAEAIERLLAAGAWRVHVRKPGVEEKDVAHLLEDISPKYRKRISLHDCHSLARVYGVGGVHLNGRNPLPPDGFDGLVSRSCHSFGELSMYAPGCDYMFLSPVFDSISKQGYKSHFSLDEIKAQAGAGVIGENTFALGGVTPDNVPLLAEAGFGGAAVLGYVWRPYVTDGSMTALVSRFGAVCCKFRTSK